MIASEVEEQAQRRKELGRRLRIARAEFGVTASELAIRSGITRSQISRIENGWVVPTLGTLDALAGVLNLADADVRWFRSEISRVTRNPTATEVVADGTYVSQQLLLQLESGASCIRVHIAGLVPALLQTPAMGAHVLRGMKRLLFGSDATIEYDIEHEVLLRTRRQAELMNPAKRFEFILHESVFEMLERSGVDVEFQLMMIRRIAQRPNVSVRIAFDTQAFPVEAMTYGFLDETVAIVDTSAGWMKTTWPTDVGRYKAHWELIAELSLSEADSLDVLRNYEMKARGHY